MKRFDRMFEIHRRARFEERMPEGYVPMLAAMGCPVVMLEKHPDIPNSVAFPLEECKAKLGDYFASSVAYMIAMAILEGATEIQIYGIDMLTESEYAVQRPNVEYLLGMARGLGIVVKVAEGSTLLKSNFRYGAEMPNELGGFDEPYWEDRRKLHKSKVEEHRGNAFQLEGALKEFEKLHELGALQSPTGNSPHKGVPLEKFIAERINFYRTQIDLQRRALWSHDGAKQEAQVSLDYCKEYARGGIIPGRTHVGGTNDAGTVTGAIRGDAAKLSEIGGLGVAESRRVPNPKPKRSSRKKPCGDCGDKRASAA